MAVTDKDMSILQAMTHATQNPDKSLVKSAMDFMPDLKYHDIKTFIDKYPTLYETMINEKARVCTVGT